MNAKQLSTSYLESELERYKRELRSMQYDVVQDICVDYKQMTFIRSRIQEITDELRYRADVLRYDGAVESSAGGLR
jgi:hypothetical protein